MQKNIAIIAAKNNPEALAKKDALVKKFGFKDLTFDHKKSDGIDLLIAVGGDGLMLHLLHEFEKNPLPIYGINCGTVGFLMNSFHEENFLDNLTKAQVSTLHPLRMEVIDTTGKNTAISPSMKSRFYVNQAKRQKLELKLTDKKESTISLLTAF